MRRSRGEGGGMAGCPDPPLINHKNKEILSDTGSDLAKIYKATKPVFNVGSSSANQRNAI